MVKRRTSDDPIETVIIKLCIVCIANNKSNISFIDSFTSNLNEVFRDIDSHNLIVRLTNFFGKKTCSTTYFKNPFTLISEKM